MNYLKKNPDQSVTYPFNLETLKLENPTVSFPDQIEQVAESWGCYPVNPTQQPEYNSITHTLMEGEPVLTNGQYVQVWEVVEYDLEQAKANKLNALNSEWQQLLNQGWESGQGKLGLTAEDVALLAGNFALAKESAAMGGPVPPLISKENNIITFASIQELTMMMLAYGQARSTLSLQYSERIRAVESATNIQELEGV